MSDDANPLEDAIEQALDAFLYAPIGLVFEGPALFPSLVQKGRNQVEVARMMGEMAVQMGQKEATKRARTAQEQMRSSLATMGLVPEPDAPAPAANRPGRSPSTSKKAGPKKAGPKKKAEPKKAAAGMTPTTRAGTAEKSATATKRASPTPSPEGLGIPDYDSLSASQVVSRLRGLGADELERVKDYESATRARKTILNKISQLQKA